MWWRNLGSLPARHNKRMADESFMLSQGRRDIAAVYGRGVAGGFQLQRLVQERLRHVLGGHFAAEQIPGHIFLFGHATRLRTLLDEIVREQARADSVGIDGI